MKKISSLFIVASLLAGTHVYAQDWTQMMKDHNANVHDVQKSFSAWYGQDSKSVKHASLDTKEEEEDGNFMLFKRWEYNMEVRTYPSGTRPDMIAIASEYQNFLNSRATQRTANTNQIQSSANWTYAGNTSVPSGGGGAGR